ncbi:MAG: protein kinase domain-containing protein [Wenzhouxiangella sp.]
MTDKTPDHSDEGAGLTQFETLIEQARQLEAAPAVSEWPAIDPERFTLLRMLGQGGMGVVFLAQQLEPIQRQVALKLIRRRVRNTEGLARFEVECQALARMQHPNIAQVYDAGTTTEGHPYFVMEFVDGMPLGQYCLDRRLSIEQRLRLFMQVCRGVQHAHQKGIIHRDLKPANILVSEVDGVATPKIIDFGIATSVGVDGQAQRDSRAGTPHYMSPEQFREAEAGLDTRSDVYSLGVILYELLVDELPIPRASFTLGATLTEMATVFEHARQRPSELLTSRQSAAGVASLRRTTPRRLRQRLRNDLDAVVMKALALEPEHRYSAPGDLAADIERTLKHEPISALPDRRIYRMRKFMRRHALALGSASAVLLALLAGLTAATMGMIEAQRQFKIAEQRQQELEQVTRFQQAMLEAINPQDMGRGIVEEIQRQWRSGLSREGLDPQLADQALAEAMQHVNSTDLARQVVSRHVLEYAIDSVESEFFAQPALQAELYTAIHSVFDAIEFYDRLPELAARILERRQLTEAPDSPAVIRAELELAWSHFLVNELELADSRFSALLERLDRDRPDHRDSIIQAMGNQATVRADQGRLADALALSRDSVTLARDWLAPDSLMTIRVTNTAGFVHARAREIEQALAYFEEGLAAMRAALPEDDPRIGRGMLNVASALGQLGRQHEALELDPEIVEFATRVHGRRSPNTLRAMSNMANNLAAVGRMDEAISLLQETTALAEEALGADDPQTLRARLNLGSILARSGEPGPARSILEDVLERRIALLGSDHPDTLSAQEVLASIVLDLNQFAEGLSLSEDLLARRMAVLGPDHGQTRLAHQLIGRALLGLGEHARAEEETAQAFEFFLATLGPNHGMTLGTALQRYRIAIARGDEQTAERLYAEHLAALRRIEAPNAQLERLSAELAQLRPE